MCRYSLSVMHSGLFGYSFMLPSRLGLLPISVLLLISSVLILSYFVRNYPPNFMLLFCPGSAQKPVPWTNFTSLCQLWCIFSFISHPFNFAICFHFPAQPLSKSAQKNKRKREAKAKAKSSEPVSRSLFTEKRSLVSLSEAL